MKYVFPAVLAAILVYSLISHLPSKSIHPEIPSHEIAAAVGEDSQTRPHTADAGAAQSDKAQ